MVSRRVRAIAVLAVVLALWTAVVVRWGEVARIWVPDDPYDGGAILAAQYGGTAIAGVVWLVGFIVIGLVAVWLNAWIQQVREVDKVTLRRTKPVRPAAGPSKPLGGTRVCAVARSKSGGAVGPKSVIQAG